MYYVRLAQSQDIPAIVNLAKTAHPGLTSLRPQPDVIATYLDPHNHYHYLFVLVDSVDNQVYGVSRIDTEVGHEGPVYHYQVLAGASLVRAEKYTGFTELCSLRLDPKLRGHGVGKLLSRARCLYIAYFHQQFAPMLVAEMRGISDDQGYSPFWDCVRDLPEAVAELPPSARAVLGRVHPDTEPAKHILEAEGFEYKGYVHTFDAGPVLEIKTEKLWSYRYLVSTKIRECVASLAVPDRLLGSARANFRALVGPCEFDNQGCRITQAAADILQVKPGDLLCHAPWK